MNESYRLQKRNKFHKESLPVELNSRSSTPQKQGKIRRNLPSAAFW